MCACVILERGAGCCLRFLGQQCGEPRRLELPPGVVGAAAIETDSKRELELVRVIQSHCGDLQRCSPG